MRRISYHVILLFDTCLSKLNKPEEIFDLDYHIISNNHIHSFAQSTENLVAAIETLPRSIIYSLINILEL